MKWDHAVRHTVTCSQISREAIMQRYLLYSNSTINDGHNRINEYFKYQSVIIWLA